MIARIWEGEVYKEDRESYFDYLKKTGIPDYRDIKGNRGVLVLRRDQGETSHFLLLTLWESMEAIEAFAGDPVHRARYYPEDEDYLIEMRPTVDHYQVMMMAGPGQDPSVVGMADQDQD